MNKTFIENEELLTLANRVIKDHGLEYINLVRVKYLLVDPYISKSVHGKCIKANNELKYFGKFDYLIEFSLKSWETLDDQTRYIIMYHELLHILVKEKKDKQILAIANHDTQDFYSILKKYGIDWFKQFKDAVAATYELEGPDKDKITI